MSITSLSGRILNHILNMKKNIGFEPVFISADDPEDFICLVNDIYRGLNDQFLLYAYELKPGITRELFYPFIHLIRQRMNQTGISPEKLVDEAGIYPLKKELLIRHLSGKLYEDPEEIIYDELQYDILKIYESIGLLISTLFRNQTIVLSISGLENAQSGIYQLMQLFDKSIINCRLFIISSFQESHSSGDMQEESFNHFKSLMENIGSTFQLRHKDRRRSTPIEVLWQSNIPVSTVEEKTAAINLHIHFHQYDDAGVLVNELLSYPQLPSSIYQDLLLKAGIISYYQSDYDFSLQHFQSLIDRDPDKSNHTLLSEVYRYMGYCYIRKHDFLEAQSYGLLSKKLAEDMNNSVLYIKALFLIFIIAEIQTTMMDYEGFLELVRLLEEHQWMRMLAYALKDSYFYFDFLGSYEEVNRLCDRAIRISTGQQNELAIAAELHKKAVISSFSGDYESTLDYLKQSESIRIRLGEPLGMIRITNGIAYYYQIQENYSDSFQSILQSVEMLPKINNYSEILITLFNLAQLYCNTRNYDHAIQILNSVIQMMAILKITQIPFRSIKDIYILKSFAHYKAGHVLKSMEYFLKVPDKNEICIESCFYRTILESWYALDNNQTAILSELFDTAEKLLNPSIKTHELLLPDLFIEKTLIYHKINNQNAMKEAIRQGVELCRKLNYSIHENWLLQFQKEENSSSVLFSLKFLNLDLNTLIEFARKEVVLNKLHKRIREIQFLNSLQNLLKMDYSREVIYQQFTSLLSSNFPSDYLLIHTFDKSQWNLVISKSRSGSLPDLESLIPMIREKPAAFLTDPKRDTELLELFNPPLVSILNIKEFSKKGSSLNIFIGSNDPDTHYSQNDLDIMTIASGQLMSELDRIEYNEELKRLSLTDALTGLNNRLSLQNKLKEESSRVRRYRNSYPKNLSIAIIDMDNFKYYNDTFGHSAGDHVIKAFSRLLVENFRDTDFISRMGGDEFVILMTETGKSQSIQVIERIMCAIFESNHLIPEIEKFLNKQVSIPDHRKITCSIGISTYDPVLHQDGDSDYLMKILLNEADKALYYSKDKGKNCYHHFNDLNA